MSFGNDPFLEELARVSGELEKKPLAKLVDPQTGKAIEFDDPAKLQEAVNLMYNAATQNAQLAQQRAAELEAWRKAAEDATKTKPAPKSAKASGSMSEEEVEEFRQKLESDPVKGIQFLLDRTDTTKKLRDELANTRKELDDFRQAFNTTTFVGQNKDLLQNPQQMQAVGQQLAAMGIQNPNQQQMQVALMAARGSHPELFAAPDPGQAPQWQQPNGAPYGGFRPAPPSPPRTATAAPAVDESTITAQINALYDKEGPDAARAFLEKWQQQQGGY